MFPEMCPVCHYMSYKEESGEYYSDGMQISPDEGYCSHCDFRYSQHVKHPMEEQVKKHIKWLKKVSNIYKEIQKGKIKEVKTFPVNPKRLDKILKKIGRRKL